MNQNQSGKKIERKKKKSSFCYIPVVLLIALFIFIVTTVFVMMRSRQPGPAEETDSTTEKQTDAETAPDTEPPASETAPPETDARTEPATEPETEPQTEPETEPETAPPVTYGEITVSTAGDLMFHMPQVNTAYLADSGTYDFTDVFQFVAPEMMAADLAILNFETTLGDPAYPYQSYPTFISPDSVLDAVKGAGFDLMLFANNHTYDNGLAGVQRTVSKFKEYGLSWLGAREKQEDPTYGIVEVGGVKLGMINFAHDLGWDPVNRTINGIPISANDLGYIDLFNRYLHEAFYAEAERRIGELKENGADLILFFIHWGDEYYTSPNDEQKEIAQKLCDLGADAIIGSHPHVVQPVEILNSTVDPERKTICFYSLGNYVSNQCRETLSAEYCHGNNKNTEMGLTVTLTIRKYSTGECMISGVNTMTTWVHRYLCPDGFFDYRILPAEKAAKDPSAYGLDSDYYPAEAVATVNGVTGNAVEVFNASLLLPDGTAA